MESDETFDFRQLYQSFRRICVTNFRGKNFVRKIHAREKIKSMKANLPKTRNIHTTRYKSIAFSREEIGACSLKKFKKIIISFLKLKFILIPAYLTLLKMLIRTRKSVTSRAILKKEKKKILSKLKTITKIMPGLIKKKNVMKCRHFYL